ncbi:MAG: tRNA lysidine(34) synthetase TilS [Prosthecobacter sp.]|nr:tRNA lysidine(34) synthetase TilS [Prosthecobacter sp.]
MKPCDIHFPSGRDAPALLAISGGRDSVALLHLMVSAGYSHLVLCHLNHGLRGRESGQDAAFVRRLAKRYDLVCEIEKVDVQAVAKAERISTELAARNVRYEFLYRMAKKHGANHVYLAHHADDQAETILANLCRGTGIGGLKGMLAETATQPILGRPLLQIQRTEIDAYIEAQQLSYREDSSNESLVHRRNRLRHEVLPLLNQVYDRDVAPIIARLGRQAGRDDDCLWQQALAFIQDAAAIAQDGSLLLSKQIRSLHPAVLSRILSHWLGGLLKVPGIESELLDSAMAMLQPGGPAKINLPGNRHLRRKAGRLWVVG